MKKNEELRSMLISFVNGNISTFKRDVQELSSIELLRLILLAEELQVEPQVQFINRIINYLKDKENDKS